MEQENRELRQANEILRKASACQLAINDQTTQVAQYRDLVVAYKNGFPIRLNNLATVTDSIQDVIAAAFLVDNQR